MIPDALADLGAVFVPVPAGKKGARVARDPEHLHHAGEPGLREHLAAGGNYGVTCRGDLAVLDADDPDALTPAIRCLPDTLRQTSGSGEGEHYFFEIPGLDGGRVLTDPDTGEHVGDLKAAEQEYVIGPGSTHPTGGTYGPLRGEAVATVDVDTFHEILGPYLGGDGGAGKSPAHPQGSTRSHRPPVDGEPDLDDVITPSQYPTETRCPHPCHGSSTGANFKVHEGREVAYCYRHDAALRGLHLWAIDEGLISCGDVGRHGELDRGTWREVYDAARAAGYDLPPPAAEHEAVRCLLPSDPTPADTWGGLRADRPDPDLSLDAAREQAADVIQQAAARGDRTVIDALPSLGKSYTAARLPATVDRPVTYLTHRYETREQAAETAREAGLNVYTLPVFGRDCPTAHGAHGDEWADRFQRLYEAGLRPSEIHERAVDAPCQHEGRCPYAAQADVDPDEFDVVIGHYTHAHLPTLTAGRVVVLDEHPGEAYERTLSAGAVRTAVATLLDRHPDLPVDDLDGLRAVRDVDDVRADILAALTEYDDLRAPTLADLTAGAHVDAPAAAVALLAGEDLGNGFEYTRLDGVGTAVYERATGRLTLRRPPDLDDAAAVLGLDGTPCMPLWEARLGTRLTRRQVLDDPARRQYLTDTLGNTYYQTTDDVRPYSSGEYVDVDRDTDLLAGIADTHGERPAVITSAKAERQLVADDGPATEYVDDTEHYGNLKSSNEYADHRLGAVLGSPHYGDRPIQVLAALDGEAVERGDGKGRDLTYGSFGDSYLRHVREHNVVQAALRFGRGTTPATVYLATGAVPEWFPTERVPGVVRPRFEGEQAVLQALTDRRRASTSTLAEAAGLSERQTRRHLNRLADEGHVHREGSGPATEHVVDDLPDDPGGAVVDLPEPAGGSTRTAAVGESSTSDVRIASGKGAAEPVRWALGAPPEPATGADRPPDGVPGD